MTFFIKVLVVQCIICSVESFSFGFETREKDKSLLEKTKHCLGQYGNFTSTEILESQNNEDPFYLNYDEPAVEILEMISSKDIKRIVKLSRCIELLSPSNFHSEVPHHNNDKHIGYGNITHLNGFFHSLIAPIYRKIVDAADKVIDNMDSWKVPNSYRISQLGIRCVRLVSFTSEHTMMKPEDVKVMKAKIRQETAVFVVHPSEPYIPPTNDDENEDEVIILDSDMHPDSDMFVSRFIQPSDDSIFTLFIPLCERDEYIGGTILIKKDYDIELNSNHTKLKIVKDFDDDDEDNDIEQQKLEKKESDQLNERHFKNKHKFDPLTTEMVRHVPDKGNGILLLSDRPHGLQPIQKGHLEFIVFEFWPYEHADVGTTHRLTLKEAKPLKRNPNTVEL